MTKSDIQLIKSLSDKRCRAETGLFVVEGRKSVDEFLNSDFRVREVWDKNLDRVSFLKTPSDCLALVEIPQWNFEPAKTKNRIVLALDGVQNPGNVGTIIRLADWFGIRDVLCSEDSADCFNPKVVQATMGALTRVRVHYGDLVAMIAQIKNETNAEVYGTFLEGESIYKARLQKEGVVVFGSEGRGISDAVAATITHRLLIPSLNPRAESLNVAVAAGIITSKFFGT